MYAPIPSKKPDFSAIFTDQQVPASGATQSVASVEQPVAAQERHADGIPGAGLLPIMAIGYLFYRRVKKSKIVKDASVKEAADLRLAIEVINSIDSGDYYRDISSNSFGAAAEGINLSKGEIILFATRSQYYRDRVTKHYSGRSVGTTLRVAGMPLRFGASKGKPIDVRETILESDGTFVLTNKAVYFNGDKKSLRILLGKIVSYRADKDTIVIQRDAETAYPQRFAIPFRGSVVVERLLDDAVSGVVADMVSVSAASDDVSPEMVLAMGDAQK